MFTGIIEEIGIVKEFIRSGHSALITIKCEKILEDYFSPLTSHLSLIGDSIAIDGVCQTVVKFDKNSFSVQVSAETLDITTFSRLKTGDKVNLERALTINTRLGGHIVSGHVDGLGKIKSVKSVGNEFYDLKLEVEKDLTKYIVKKGSITINGISLTVADISSNEVSVAVIPQTFEHTNLNNLKSGDYVNIEVDILAKYVEKLLSTGNNSSTVNETIRINKTQKINENFLKENGF